MKDVTAMVVKNRRTVLILGTILCLIFVSLFVVFINKNTLETGKNRTVHIREMNNNLLFEDRTQDQWIETADLIIGGKITNISFENGEQVVVLNPERVYKGNDEKEITIHSRNITFEKDKAYLMFLELVDKPTLESARYYPIADCAWEVQGKSLDYVPAAFSEIKSLPELEEKIKNSSGIAIKSKKKEIKNSFSSLEEKFESANAIFIGKVSEILIGTAGDVVTFEGDPIEVFKGNGNSHFRDLVVNKKYNVKVEDTVLVFTNGRTSLAGRSDCLYKINEKGYKENYEFLKAKENK